MSGEFGIGNQKSKMEFDLTMVSKLVKFFEFFAWENVLHIIYSIVGFLLNRLNFGSIYRWKSPTLSGS